MPVDTKKRCHKQVNHPGSWHKYNCALPAKYELDGLWYCGVHNPAAKERREAKSNAAYKRAVAERQAPFSKISQLAAENTRLRQQLAGLKEAVELAYNVLDARLSPSEWQHTRAKLLKARAACKATPNEEATDEPQ